MLSSAKFRSPFDKIWFLKQLSKSRCCNFSSFPYGYPGSSITPSSAEKRVSENIVAIFWDLDNKPPKSFPPYDAAVRLKKAAQKFGFVRYMIAYANRHAFSYVPPKVREHRRDRKAGVIKKVEPYLCRCCGRKFYNEEKLVNHFKQIHEQEQIKRMNRIESARGKRRVRMAAMYSMKMEKYKNAAREILNPKIGYGLGDELKRAGFWVLTVSDKPQAADVALRNHIVDLMDRRAADCFFLVSDDSDFVGVLKEARERCLKTVVVGDDKGCLKRFADDSFSWEEIRIGKVKTQAVSVVRKWKDGGILKGLEWVYDPEIEKKSYYKEIGNEGSDVEGFVSIRDECGTYLEDGGRPWWKLEPRSKEPEND